MNHVRWALIKLTRLLKSSSWFLRIVRIAASTRLTYCFVPDRVGRALCQFVLVVDDDHSVFERAVFCLRRRFTAESHDRRHSMHGPSTWRERRSPAGRDISSNDAVGKPGDRALGRVLHWIVEQAVQGSFSFQSTDWQWRLFMIRPRCRRMVAFGTT